MKKLLKKLRARLLKKKCERCSTCMRAYCKSKPEWCNGPHNW